MIEQLQAENQLLRVMLFLAHPCVGKYGDDGELQCNSCVIDFKRDSAIEIDARISMKALQRASEFVQEAKAAGFEDIFAYSKHVMEQRATLGLSENLIARLQAFLDREKV